MICEREEQAIRAARQLKVEWKQPGDRAVPGLRASCSTTCVAPRPPRRASQQVQGDPAAALAGAARVIEAEYEVPFQGHTAIGPAHALADPSDGQMTIYSNDMKAYGLRTGVAKFLDMPREKVRVVYMDGPQVYGRTAADDAGFEAAFLAQEAGPPGAHAVDARRRNGLGYQGPCRTCSSCVAGWTTNGKVVALEYDACAADHNHLWYNEPDTVLIAQLMGRRPEQPGQGQRRSAVGDVCHSEPAHDHARRRAADDLGNAAAHRQPARSQRTAGDLRLRVVHRRTGRGGQGRSRAVPPRHAGGQPRRTTCSARRARSPWCARLRRPMDGMRARHRDRARRHRVARCFRDAASPTPTAATPLPRSSPKSR